MSVIVVASLPELVRDDTDHDLFDDDTDYEEDELMLKKPVFDRVRHVSSISPEGRRTSTSRPGENTRDDADMEARRLAAEKIAAALLAEEEQDIRRQQHAKAKASKPRSKAANKAHVKRISGGGERQQKEKEREEQQEDQVHVQESRFSKDEFSNDEIYNEAANDDEIRKDTAIAIARAMQESEKDAARQLMKLKLEEDEQIKFLAIAIANESILREKEEYDLQFEVEGVEEVDAAAVLRQSDRDKMMLALAAARRAEDSKETNKPERSETPAEMMRATKRNHADKFTSNEFTPMMAVASGLPPAMAAVFGTSSLVSTLIPGEGVDTNPPKLSDEDGDADCVICLESERDVVLMPCAHFVVCKPCWDKLKPQGEHKECPICRHKVTSATVVLSE